MIHVKQCLLFVVVSICIAAMFLVNQNQEPDPSALADPIPPMCSVEAMNKINADWVGDQQIDEAIRALITQLTGRDFLEKYNPTTDRWPGVNGDPLALTWSFVPDGTPHQTISSNLFNKLDTDFAAFGAAARATWVQRWQDGFNRWQELTGITFTRITAPGQDWDDGAPWNSPGVAGVRGDIRIFGINLGPPGLAAFTQLPSHDFRWGHHTQHLHQYNPESHRLVRSILESAVGFRAHHYPRNRPCFGYEPRVSQQRHHVDAAPGNLYLRGVRSPARRRAAGSFVIW